MPRSSSAAIPRMKTSKNGSSAANAEYLELVMSFLLDTIGDELGAHLVRPIISIDDRVARGIGREGSQGPQHTLKEVRASGAAETTRRACRRGGALPCQEAAVPRWPRSRVPGPGKQA